MQDSGLRLYARIAATGISFAVFGLGGLVFQIVIFPLLNLLVWQPELRHRIARRLIRHCFGFFVEMMRVLGVLTYEIHGAEKLARRGLLVLANHPSLVDVVILMSLIRNPDCVVRSGLRNNPFTRGPIRAAGFISNGDGAALIEDCIESLGRGNNLIIFPEGTRTPRTSEMRFQRGAANIAVRGRVRVTPVVIRCEPQLLAKGDIWYRVPSRRPHFVISVQDDIDVAPFIGQDREPALVVRDLTGYLQSYFYQEVAVNGSAGAANQANHHRESAAGRPYAG